MLCIVDSILDVPALTHLSITDYNFGECLQCLYAICTYVVASIVVDLSYVLVECNDVMHVVFSAY